MGTQYYPPQSTSCTVSAAGTSRAMQGSIYESCRTPASCRTRGCLCCDTLHCLKDVCIKDLPGPGLLPPVKQCLCWDPGTLSRKGCWTNMPCCNTFDLEGDLDGDCVGPFISNTVVKLNNVVDVSNSSSERISLLLGLNSDCGIKIGSNGLDATNSLKNTIAIGKWAGNADQLEGSIAIGYKSGFLKQDQDSISIGESAGESFSTLSVYCNWI